MFKVKAKTNSVKLKDINKYIGRVWVLLKDAEVKKSKDLLNNKHKLIIQTDNEQFKEMFNVKSTVTKSTVQNIEVVQDKNMFVAQPNEKPVDKVEEVFVAEQPTLDFEIQTTILPYTFDVDKRADELLEELNEAQQETNTIEEQFTPCDINETDVTISTQETTVEDVQVEEPFVPQIDEGITETNEIKTEESFIYNTKTDDTSKKRRGRPKKSNMD